jgi:RNA polymerase sigma factor (TIGR02999 family)
MVLGSASSNQFTELLARWSQGESAAREKLVPLVYDDLRRVARHCLAGERPDHTLQSAALVHEAYLRLVGHESVQWDDRVHFFAVAAQLMRRILVDHARKRRAGKRGGEAITLSLVTRDGHGVPSIEAASLEDLFLARGYVTAQVLDEQPAPAKKRALDVIALDDALNELTRMNPQHGRIVEMRFFAGLSVEDTAQAMGISPAAVKRDWAVARAWLYRELARTTPI